MGADGEGERMKKTKWEVTDKEGNVLLETEDEQRARAALKAFDQSGQIGSRTLWKDDEPVEGVELCE